MDDAVAGAAVEGDCVSTAQTPTTQTATTTGLLDRTFSACTAFTGALSRAVDIDRQRSVLFGHRLRALAALSHYGAGALPAEVDPGRPRFHPDGPTGDVWLSGLEIAAAEYAAASTVSPREAQEPSDDTTQVDTGTLSGIDASDVENVAEVLRRFPGLWPFVGYTHYRRPQILAKIVVPATVLAGADDWACELARFGPIDPDLARELASDARWQLMLSDPGTGQVIDVGATYRPPAAMRRRIKARDHHCRWPGCDAAADRCEIDHAIAFPQGSTSDDNCLCLCKFHHRVKHQTGVSITMVNGGPTVITTATGRAYRTSPPRAGPTKPITRLGSPAQC